jgi:hypothetical protein
MRVLSGEEVDTGRPVQLLIRVVLVSGQVEAEVKLFASWPQLDTHPELTALYTPSTSTNMDELLQVIRCRLH